MLLEVMRNSTSVRATAEVYDPPSNPPRELNAPFVIEEPALPEMKGGGRAKLVEPDDDATWPTESWASPESLIAEEESTIGCEIGIGDSKDDALSISLSIPIEGRTKFLGSRYTKHLVVEFSLRLGETEEEWEDDDFDYDRYAAARRLGASVRAAAAGDFGVTVGSVAEPPARSILSFGGREEGNRERGTGNGPAGSRGGAELGSSFIRFASILLRRRPRTPRLRRRSCPCRSAARSFR